MKSANDATLNGRSEASESSRPPFRRILSKEEGIKELVDMIRRNLFISGAVHEGPFGPRKVIYCDHTATGESLRCIEDFIQKNVLPYYGNTHTTSTFTSSITTNFRHEARGIIRNAVKASEHDAVILCGSGATGAIHKLVHALTSRVKKLPIVFTSPYEHHSNILPWRDAGCEVIAIPEAPDGLIDLNQLEDRLRSAALVFPNRRLIGSFSVASNITGVVAKDVEMTVLMHKYGGLAVWDYSAAAPHVEIVMNPIDPVHGELARKDAIFFSGHKFLGGPQTPGVLIIKDDLFTNELANGGGGGSVFFVTDDHHRYLKNAEYREEGGTPAIIEAIRLGQVFRLKETLTAPAIVAREQKYINRAIKELKQIPELKILGNLSHPRLPILSFLIEHPDSGYFLHYNFVVALLNDLFGIQARGGCACAAPYAYKLLNINSEIANKYEELLLEDCRLNRKHLRRYQEGSQYEIYRPGFTRLSFAYYSSDEEVDFIIEAIRLIAQEGWKLLPLYKYDLEKGEFQHSAEIVERKWLSNAVFDGQGLSDLSNNKNAPKGLKLTECMAKAKDAFAKSQELCRRISYPDQRVLFEQSTSFLRWFILPSEASRFLKHGSTNYIRSEKIFSVKQYSCVDYSRYLAINDTIIKEMNALTDFPFPFQPHREMENYEKLEQNYDTCEFNGNFMENVPFNGSGELQKNEYISLRNTEDSTALGRSESPVHSEAEIAEKVSRIIKKIATEPMSLDKFFETNCNLSPVKVDNSLEDDNSHWNALSSEGDSISSYGSNIEVPGQVEKDSVNDYKTPQQGICERKTMIVPAKSSTARWHSPPNSIFKSTMRALKEFSMIDDGDRVLVCLSGGKDSLSLLHTLRQTQFVLKSQGIHFEIGAVTVDPQSSSYDPKPLIPYLASLGVQYFYKSQNIMDEALKMKVTSICSYCSRMKRGVLYATARENKYNVLAFGQHLDDLAESFIMSIFHNGFLRTIKASYTVDEKDLRVIRPFVYLREEKLREFAESRGLPVIPDNCPACFKEPKERHRVKQLLAAQELLFPNLYGALRSAMYPLYAIDKTGIESRTRKLSGERNEDYD